MAIDFALSENQGALAESFGRFFASECGPEVVRAAEPLGFDAELWAQVVGLGGHTVRADGASLAETVVIAETLGATVAPAPLIEHWVATELLTSLAVAGDVSLDATTVSRLAAGEIRATIALGPAAAGVWQHVPAGAVAQVVVGLDGDDVVAVSAPPPMTGPTNHGCMPLANRSSTDGDELLRLGPGSADSRDRFSAAMDHWRLFTAASLTGLAQQALDIGVAYVGEREQFGRPIGAYQSIQHALADLPALIDGARFLTHKAAWAGDNGFEDGAGIIDVDRGNISELAPLASMAFLAASDAAMATTERCLHYHGGYGFSAEYDIQLFFRRARGWSQIAGDPAQERARLAELLWPRNR